MMTALAITRERERGTMENLLAMPVRPLEVMRGKIVPYILVGYVQVAIILSRRAPVRRADARQPRAALSARWCCSSPPTLASASPSRRSRADQLQAMQMTFFFFLPSMLLSGFMFPFRGMPGWAQAVGEVLAAHPFPAHRPRHPAEGQRRRRRSRRTCGRSPCSCWPSPSWLCCATGGRSIESAWRLRSIERAPQSGGERAFHPPGRRTKLGRAQMATVFRAARKRD